MLVVETIAKIRRAYFAQNKPIKTICREFRVSRRVVRKVIRSQATEFRYQRSRQPLPRIDPWRDQLEGLLLENEGKPARERLTRIRMFEELRALGYEGSYDAIRRYAKRWRTERGAATAEAGACPGEGRGTAELCPRRGVPVRLVARDRADQRGDRHRQGGACPAVPQPHAVCARLSARDPGDGVRRPQSRLCLLQGGLHARHLRQHEDRGRCRVYWQRPPVQPPLSADVWPLPGRAHCLHAGFGLGEGPGREP